MEIDERSLLVKEIAEKVIATLEPKFTHLEDELKKVIRRQESQENTLGVLDKDREIMEDSLSTIRQIHELLKSHRDHQYTANREISSNIQGVTDQINESARRIAVAVVENIDALQEEVQKVKKVKKNSLFDKIFNRNKEVRGENTKEVNSHNAEPRSKTLS